MEYKYVRYSNMTQVPKASSSESLRGVLAGLKLAL